MHKLTGWILGVGIWLFAGCQTLSPPGESTAITFAGDIPEEGTAIMMEFDQAMFVPVRIGDREFSFVLDTGSQIDFIHPERLEGTGIEVVPERSLRFNESEGHQMGRGAVFQLGEATYKPSFIGVTTFVERLGQMYGRRVDGVLGAGVLHLFLTAWDAEQGVLLLKHPATEIEGVPLELKIGLPLVGVQFQTREGEEVEGNFLLDTGFNGNLKVDQRWLDSKEIRLERSGLIPNKFVRFDEEGQALTGRFPKVRVGGFTFTNVVFDTDSDHFIEGGAGLLGAGLLRRMHTVIDLEELEVQFQPNALAAEPFHFDQSGLGISAQGPELNELLIEFVRPGSPGAEAGITEGDKVLAVNGKPAQEWNLPELRKLLREASGETVELVLERNGAELKHKIVLRPLL